MPYAASTARRSATVAHRKACHLDKEAADLHDDVVVCGGGREQPVNGWLEKRGRGASIHRLRAKRLPGPHGSQRVMRRHTPRLRSENGMTMSAVMIHPSESTVASPKGLSACAVFEFTHTARAPP